MCQIIYDLFQAREVSYSVLHQITLCYICLLVCEQQGSSWTLQAEQMDGDLVCFTCYAVCLKEFDGFFGLSIGIMHLILSLFYFKASSFSLGQAWYTQVRSNPGIFA